MPYDPNFPPTNAELISAEFRNQFQGLKALIDAVPAGPAGPAGAQGPQGAVGPQGAPGATGAPGISVPIGGVFAWMKNLAGIPALGSEWVECNGQVLNDVDSPLNGITLPDLNNAQRFLRGASASGGTGGTDEHSHAVDDNAGVRVIQQGSDFGVNFTSSLPSYYEVVWVIRVK
jgi:hypothetical protein